MRWTSGMSGRLRLPLRTGWSSAGGCWRWPGWMGTQWAGLTGCAACTLTHPGTGPCGRSWTASAGGRSSASATTTGMFPRCTWRKRANGTVYAGRNPSLSLPGRPRRSWRGAMGGWQAAGGIWCGSSAASSPASSCGPKPSWTTPGSPSSTLPATCASPWTMASAWAWAARGSSTRDASPSPPKGTR